MCTRLYSSLIADLTDSRMHMSPVRVWLCVVLLVSACVCVCVWNTFCCYIPLINDTALLRLAGGRPLINQSCKAHSTACLSSWMHLGNCASAVCMRSVVNCCVFFCA